MKFALLSDAIKNPPAKYRPLPFWSWNERLLVDETENQIRLMHGVGMGGFFMHARGGLVTEYMGKEWFSNVGAAISEAERLGMGAWAYDENGWPSGFAGGAVNSLGEEYCQKQLKMDESGNDGENTVAVIDGVRYYYEVNPAYVDNLDKRVVKEFIKNAYEPYYEKFGNRIRGFFTDEPQIIGSGIPWSACLAEEYEREYGEELLPRLSHLFRDSDGAEDTRIKFFSLVTRLFSESYLKQIYEFCDERGLMLTGHLLCEDTLGAQLAPNGACMPHYRYFHIPGIDWLGRETANPLPPHQVASVAAQYGKKQILSESFALCGHGVSFSELRKIVEFQMVRGVNLLCPHLQGYSMRGIRKRDYPPAMGYQQPWWDEYFAFVDAMSRIGMLVGEGESDAQVLLLHPEVDAWARYNEGGNRIAELDKKFMCAIGTLEKKHISFHLGDEIILRDDAVVEGGALVIGKMRYTTVALIDGVRMLDSTRELLAALQASGGKVISPEDIPESKVCDNENITYLKRHFDDFDMHYFVNSTDRAQSARLEVCGVKLNVMTGEREGFSRDYEFSPYDSLVVLDFHDGACEKTEKASLVPLSLDGEWEVSECSDNSLTLDVCDFYMDGELIERDMPVISIQHYANKKNGKSHLRLVFRATVKALPKSISLAVETPEIFKFKINGTHLEFSDSGYYVDKSIRKSDITDYMTLGDNEIELSCDFSQSPETYERIEKAHLYKNERNKLTYDMEIESIYLVGDFSVMQTGEFEMLKRNALRYYERPIICERAKKITLSHIEKQGFLNFAGKMRLKKRFSLAELNKKLVFSLKGVNAVAVSVNGAGQDSLIWEKSELDISRYLKRGDNEIEITMTTNLRNLLGPHHLDEGESHFVGPFSFFKERSFWSWASRCDRWNDGWCIIETSLID